MDDSQPYLYRWEDVFNVKTLILAVDESPTTIQEVDNEGAIPFLPGRNVKKKLILIIPGNPGCIHFYQDFAVALWRNMKKKFAVIGISHAGHVFHPLLASETFGGSSYPSLEYQVKHKRWFIENILYPEYQDITLIGHSIGAYIGLKVADEMPLSRISRVVGLFPTIERMAVTPNGKFFSSSFKYGRWFAIGAAYVLSFLPDRFHRLLLRRFLPEDGEHHYLAAKNLLQYRCLYNSLMMANDEMLNVTEIDYDLLHRQLPRTILYYGRNDLWCLESSYRDIKQRFPEAQLHLCDKDFAHAFVLRDAFSCADLVAGWLQDK